MRDDPKSGPGSDDARDLPASAGDQLHTTRQLLIYTLRYSRVFPADATNDWVDGLTGLDIGAPEAGRAVLTELREGYEWAKRQHRPDGVMAAANLSAGVFFDREVGEIDRHLDLLETLLEQAEASTGKPANENDV